MFITFPLFSFFCILHSFRLSQRTDGKVNKAKKAMAGRDLLKRIIASFRLIGVSLEKGGAEAALGPLGTRPSLRYSHENPSSLGHSGNWAHRTKLDCRTGLCSSGKRVTDH